MIKLYHLNFYLNAKHAVKWEQGMGEIHPHTWEIKCDIQAKGIDVIPFDRIERNVREFILRYQDTTLNDEKPFDNINPTLENVTEVFFHSISIVLKEVDCKLVKLLVSETPVRSFSISTSPEQV